jgi:hypothetical protein
MQRVHQTGQDTYRLIVIRGNVSKILLSACVNAWKLPTVEIPHGQRIAEQLARELYTQYGCQGYCLLVRSLAVGLPSAVMEVPEPDEIASAGTSWRPLDAATCSEIEPAEDRAIIRESLKELNVYRQEPTQGPFARAGWLRELFAWTDQQLGPLGLRLTGSFTQLNAAPTFSLIRLDTTDSAVWFKATSPPNGHELAVTRCIARLFPGNTPELLGVHAAWNGWLTKDVPGQTLDRCTELPAWNKVADDLAQLQIQSIGKDVELLESHSKDVRLPRLMEQIDPFLGCMAELMAAQEKKVPRPLTNPELDLLGEHLKQACLLLHDLGFPDTLGHLDFSPGNILVSPVRCVFLDWAEGCVTHPLVTFEYLREHLRRNRPNDTHAFETLVAAYMRPWQSLVSLDDLKQASLFSPLVAVFAYAVGTNTWRSREALLKPAIGAYLRSLTRRMHREAVEMAGRRESCLV